MLGVERVLFYLNFIAELVLVCRLDPVQVLPDLPFLVFVLAGASLTTLWHCYRYRRRTWLLFVLLLGNADPQGRHGVYVVQDLYPIALAGTSGGRFFRETQRCMAILALAAVVALAGITLDATVFRRAIIRPFTASRRSSAP